MDGSNQEMFMQLLQQQQQNPQLNLQHDFLQTPPQQQPLLGMLDTFESKPFDGDLSSFGDLQGLENEEFSKLFDQPTSSTAFTPTSTPAAAPTTTSSAKQKKAPPAQKKTKKKKDEQVEAGKSVPKRATKGTRKGARPMDEKRIKFLERNRAAATRCRERKKQWRQDLQKRESELQEANNAMHEKMRKLRAEVANLKNVLLAKKGADYVSKIELSQYSDPSFSIDSLLYRRLNAAKSNQKSKNKSSDGL